jgi:hypothetical protein
MSGPPRALVIPISARTAAAWRSFAVSLLLQLLASDVQVPDSDSLNYHYAPCVLALSFRGSILEYKAWEGIKGCSLKMKNTISANEV